MFGSMVEVSAYTCLPWSEASSLSLASIRGTFGEEGTHRSPNCIYVPASSSLTPACWQISLVHPEALTDAPSPSSTILQSLHRASPHLVHTSQPLLFSWP